MKTTLAVLNIFAGLSLLAWPILKLMSGFLFDAPGSEENRVSWAIVCATYYFYPATPIAGNVLFWVNRTKANLKTLKLYTALSFSGVLLLIELYTVLFI